jgi:prepilin-type N-terminal cleavage/methylation domain-containing protein
MRRGTARRARRSGFTIVELMIAVLVLAALGSLAFSIFGTASTGEVSVRLRSDLTQVSLRVEAQFERTQKYPLTAATYAATQSAYPGLVLTRNSQWALTSVTADQRGATVQVKDISTGRTCSVGIGSSTTTVPLSCT